jgi:hypothetical protein
LTKRARLNRVLAVVLVLWGGGIVVSGFSNGLPSADSAYGAGRLAAFGFGFVLVAAGLWTLLKKQPS